MMVDKFMTMIRLLIVILNFSKLCHCDETCFHETSLETLAANYHFKSVCSSDHISDALRSDVQCGVHDFCYKRGAGKVIDGWVKSKH